MFVLGIAPKFDEVTEYSQRWFEKIESKCERILKGRKIYRIEVEQSVNDGFDAIIFYNHGTCDALLGGPDEAVIDKNNYDVISKNVKRIYTLACLSAKMLGVRFFYKGVTYVGYIREFAFTPYDEKLFEEVVTAGALAFFEGKSPREIKEIMINAFNNAIRKARDPWTKIWLQWDRDSLRVYDRSCDKPSWWQKILTKL